MFLVPFPEGFWGDSRKSLRIASTKFPVRVLWIAEFFKYHVFAPSIIFDVFGVFLIYCMKFPRNMGGIKHGIDKESRKMIECL